MIVQDLIDFLGRDFARSEDVLDVPVGIVRVVPNDQVDINPRRIPPSPTGACDRCL